MSHHRCFTTHGSRLNTDWTFPLALMEAILKFMERALLILQPFRRFTYVIAHSPTFPLLHLRHNSFSNPYVVSPTSQIILQPFRCFTYVTTHSPTLTVFHLRHRSFSNPSVASPTSQLILQPFRCLTYVTAHSPTLQTLYLRHRHLR